MTIILGTKEGSEDGHRSVGTKCKLWTKSILYCICDLLGNETMKEKACVKILTIRREPLSLSVYIRWNILGKWKYIWRNITRQWKNITWKYIAGNIIRNFKSSLEYLQEMQSSSFKWSRFPAPRCCQRCSCQRSWIHIIMTKDISGVRYSEMRPLLMYFLMKDG